MTSNHQCRRAGVTLAVSGGRAGPLGPGSSAHPLPLLSRLRRSLWARRRSSVSFAALAFRSAAIWSARSAASAAFSPACCDSCSACCRSAASACPGVAPMPVTMPTVLPPPLPVVRILSTLAVQSAMGGTYPARMAMTTRRTRCTRRRTSGARTRSASVRRASRGGRRPGPRRCSPQAPFPLGVRSPFLPAYAAGMSVSADDGHAVLGGDPQGPGALPGRPGAYEVLAGTHVLGQSLAGSRWKRTTSSSATPSSTSRRRDRPCPNASGMPRPAANPS